MNQKSCFNWTEDKKYTLDKLALRHEGYKLTDRNHLQHLFAHLFTHISIYLIKLLSIHMLLCTSVN